jgi:glutathione S-transferase
VAELLFHVADAEDWVAARRTGRYDRSTRGRSLDDVGFVHLSTAAQWPGVLQRYYADHAGPLLLLAVDPDRLTAELRWEAPAPGSPELFPHLYGPLDADAVVAVETIRAAPGITEA